MEMNMSQVDEKMLFSGIIYSEMSSQGTVDENMSTLKMRTSSSSTTTIGGRRRRRRRKKTNDDMGVRGIGGEWKKRKLTSEQLTFLETHFGEERKLESGRKMRLAKEVGLDPKQVAVWFQNRRARWKNKQLEDEYLKIKTHHDATVVDKCHLQNENQNLKQRLSEAEEEIKKLTSLSLQSGGGGGGGGGSPISSSSTDTTFQPYFGQFGVEELDNLMIYNANDDYTFANYIMDWGYLL